MSGFKQMFKNKIWIIIALFLIIGTAIPVEAQGFLTQEEKDYIARGNRNKGSFRLMEEHLSTILIPREK